LEQATETGGKQYEQYDGKKQVVSHKVAGIKDSSKTFEPPSSLFSSAAATSVRQHVLIIAYIFHSIIFKR